MKKQKAVGSRGSWFATVDGEKLPCVHQHWISGATHRTEKGIDLANPQLSELVEAIRVGKKVVVTKDEVQGDGDGFTRLGYVAVFKIDNLVARDGLLQFDLIERVCNLH